MKKSLLIGLAAVALGSMTACSNILEEEGVVSPSAKTGTLTIGVEADASVNVTTKASEENLTEIYNSLLDEFKVELTAPSGVQLPDGLSGQNLLYKDIENNIYKLPAKTGYSLRASYGTMDDKSFAWDCPVFEGTSSSFDVVANKLTRETVSCTLQNSIIEVNVADLNTSTDDDGNGVIVTSLYAMIGNDENTKFYLMGDKVEEGKSLAGNILYVAANVDAKLIMEGHLESNSSKTFKTTATEIEAKDATLTTGKTKYKVKYTLSNANGELQLVVSIDGKVTVVDINKVVDPYTPATNS